MVKISAQDLSIRQISESGQCFRLNRTAQDRYALVAFGRYLEMEQQGGCLTLFCTQEEYDTVWSRYFDMENDYALYRSAAADADPYLARAVSFGSGIRILRQDVWEVLLSFIISQQNNIKRIRKCIETLCERYGERCSAAPGGQEICYYTFPGADALAGVPEEDLRACGLGYRSRYIVSTAESVRDHKVDLEAVKRMDFRAAKSELLKLCGVGEKVADCICLFGLHHMDAFPMDTHIRKIMDEHYPAGFPFERYRGYAGVMQQYLFYYDLCGQAQTGRTGAAEWTAEKPTAQS